MSKKNWAAMSTRAKVQAFEQDQTHNRTPLMWAVCYNQIDVVQYLLGRMSRHGLQMELKNRDRNGWTPLHIACLQPNVKVLRLLLSAGARLEERDTQRRTPLLLCIPSGNGDALRLLLESGADVRGDNGRQAIDTARELGLVEITVLLKQFNAAEGTLPFSEMERPLPPDPEPRAAAPRARLPWLPRFSRS